MSKITKADRKKALKERTTTNVSNRDKSGFAGQKRAFDFKGKEVTFWKPEKGSNHIDIIPYLITTDKHPGKLKEGYEDYILEYYMHPSVGASEDTFVCLKKTFGKPCPICEEQAILRQDENVDEDSVKALNAKRRAIYNIIDKNDEEAGIQLFEVSHFLFEKELLEEAETAEEEVIIFADIEEGTSIKFRAKEKSFGGFSFFEFKAFSFEERDEAYAESILKKSYSLDKYIVIPTYDEVRNAFLGIESEDDDGSVEEEDNDTEDEDVNEEKTRKDRKRKERKKKKDVNPCPHAHVFGTDCDEHDDCADCAAWDDCADKQEELNDE
ncbi:MAG: hypothetical protein GY870_14600 [archaeon]|nr:hypothetical protein [archaeon]